MERSIEDLKRPPGAVLAAVLLAVACSTGAGVPSEAASPIPTSSLSPSAQPSPTPGTSSVVGLSVGNLEAGMTYAITVEGSAERIIVTVPAAGWFTVDNWFLGKDALGPEGFDITLLPYVVGNVFIDPCNWLGGALDPPVGPTVDDLAIALVKQAGPDALAPTAVTLSGYPGKKVELSIPDEVRTAGCDEGDYGRWSPADDPEHSGPFTYGDGQHDTVYIVNVQDTRLVIDTNYLPGTSEPNRAELKQLVTSIRFEP